MKVAVNEGPGPGLQPNPGRIRGLDLARGLAILGMVIVHFELVLEASGRGPTWLGLLTTGLQGRAAGTFVMLAGIGASLGTAAARVSGAPQQRVSARRKQLARAAFLFLLGLVFATVWPPDILHFYGVYLALGALLLFSPGVVVTGAALLAAGIGLAFLSLADYPAHWDFETLTYRGFWTPRGFVRNLFFDGWHPVCPWVVIYLAGMLVGRAPLHDRRLRRWLALGAAGALLEVELLAHFVAPQGIETEGWGALFATTAIPPTPGYLVASIATASLVIVACCELSLRFAGSIVSVLEAAGKCALTLYVAHVVIGLGALEELGLLQQQSLWFAVGAACLFFASAALASWLWLRRFRRGPLEALMRWASG